MKENLLVTLADEKYVEQAKQLFSSAYWNGGWGGDYMLLAHKIPEKKLKWFRDKGILIKKCESLSDISENNPDIAKLSKLYLFSEELKKWKNIIFLDSDIIVIASLRQLSEVNGFYAAQDLWPRIKDQFETKADKKLFIQLKNEADIKEYAFNSGVMAFNTKCLPKNSFSRLCMLSKKYIKIRRHIDQGILNLLFYKKWNELPTAYNFNPFLIKHPFLTKKNPNIPGVILHFPGSRKPWNEKYSYYYQLWEKNLELADSIDIKKPITPTTEYSEKEIQKISDSINKKLFLHSPINYLDKIVGQAGIFLKRKTPKIYNKLKNSQIKLLKIQ